MKKLILTLAGSLLALTATLADEKTTTTTTTTSDGVTTQETQTVTSTGVLTEYAPGSTFIVKETSGPVTYSYGNKVVYTTRSGRILTEDDVKARIRVGVPVNVHYANQGETRVINRVIIDD
ncbi:hypothetical protein EI77_04628 [Prosthecobacter fusiformis]|uniref:DUF5666 domain-containing protein n=1 Tax=Prosthecobacter fusiformis TaxID=48464 RepID=A0A4R7RK20_9BACT|nr:hypothetical protein [Prosthecobacter fusiformis]TDU62527.1 hypothetical protein EI77_04628 [Prosthecobacter fusiformis]